MELTPLAGIYDTAGRYLAPLQEPAPIRPAGPWDTNAPLVVICAWCPDFDPTNPVNADATHGICPTCKETAWAA